MMRNGESPQQSEISNGRPPTVHLTQFCPHCEYDLYGLTADRCPECGTIFDRGTLPLLSRPRRRVFGLLANWMLFVALIVSTFQVSLTPGPVNTALQLARLGTAWALAGLWLWLRRAEIFTERRQHWLLWLLVLCWGTSNTRFHTSPVVPAALQGFSMFAAAAILGYALYVSTRQSIRMIVLIFSVFTGAAAAALTIYGAACYLGGYDDRGTTITVFGRSYPAIGVNFLYIAANGLGLLGASVLSMVLSRKLKPRR